jgi:integrase
VGDIKGAEVSIYRRQNNPLETRKQAPSVKTGERTIPIPDSLAQLIDNYVMAHRGSIKAARKHPYLFVSHRKNLGKPMSLNAIAEVFKSAKAVLPELKGLTPHKLRHHMNYRISRMIDQRYKDAISWGGLQIAKCSNSITDVTTKKKQEECLLSALID